MKKVELEIMSIEYHAVCPFCKCVYYFTSPIIELWKIVLRCKFCHKEYSAVKKK